MSEKIKQVAQERNITLEEFFRRALALYIYLVDETRDGSRRAAIIATDGEAVITNIEFR